MASPWAAQQQDAALLQELAEYSLDLTTIGLSLRLLHLHRQLVLDLLQQEHLALNQAATNWTRGLRNKKTPVTNWGVEGCPVPVSNQRHPACKAGALPLS